MAAADIDTAIADAESNDHLVTAVEILGRCVLNNPGDAKYLYRYADALRAVGRLAEAEAVFKKINVQDVPTQLRYLMALSVAEIYRETGRWERAEHEYRNAARERPDSTIPWVYWGAFLSRQGRIQEAVEVFTKGLDANGDLDEVHFNLGNCARALREYDRARRHYEAALSLTPTYREAAVALRDILEWPEVVNALYDSGGQEVSGDSRA